MTSRPDLARQAIALIAATAQTALPILLTPSFPRDEQPPNVMQPADYTFAVWVPIFATSIVHAVDQVRPGRSTDPALRATDWSLAAGYACTAAWAPLVASRRHWAAQSALLALAAAGEIARRRAAASDRAGLLTTTDRIAMVPSAAMLSAWGSSAATVNLTAMLVDRGIVRPGRPATVLGTVATAAAGILLASQSAATPGGRHTLSARIHGVASIWALAGIAVGQRTRSRPVALAAVAAALHVAVSFIPTRRRRP